MPHSNVDIAVKAHLAANWTHCDVLPELNVSADLPAPPFLAVTYPIANAEQKSVGAPGSNIWREEGVFLLILKVERSLGSSAYLPWADELAALFRGKSFGGVQTFAPTPPPMDNDSENGNYFELPVAVPYWYDYLG